MVKRARKRKKLLNLVVIGIYRWKMRLFINGSFSRKIDGAQIEIELKTQSANDAALFLIAFNLNLEWLKFTDKMLHDVTITNF